MEKLKKYSIPIIIGCLVILTLIYTIFPLESSGNETYKTNQFVDVEADDSYVITYIYVDIKGEVKNPGVYKLETNTRLYQLIQKSGGFTEDADINAINQSVILLDEGVYYIPHFDEGYPQLGVTDNEPIDETATSEYVNINTATLSELMTLTGIGESTAQKIIDYRTENGDFGTTEDIMNVPGIKEATYANIKDDITVS